MKYYIIAGEASGDLHGSNLVKGIRQPDPSAVIRCWGGDMMQAAGATVVKHYRDLAFMGFAEVIKNMPVILGNLRFCKKDIEDFAPDVLVLIDYPGFNLRIAKWAKQRGFKIAYYISPQVWAWKQSRVHLIKKVVDKMLVILPFEKDFYEGWDYKVDYVGHPLIEVVEAENNRTDHLVTTDFERGGNRSNPIATKGTVALLPGSRKQEISVKLPIMLEAARRFPEYNFVIARAPSQPHELYNEIAGGYSNVQIATAQTYALLRQSTAALVTSGTATLETALFNVPQVVCYKGSYISYQIAKRLVKVKFISLVNLIMNKEVVKELIQDELSVENLSRELDKILHNEQIRAGILKDYQDLRKLLQQDGKASLKAADHVYKLAIS